MNATNIISLLVILAGCAAAYQVYHLQQRVDQLEGHLDMLLSSLEKAINEAKKK